MHVDTCANIRIPNVYFDLVRSVLGLVTDRSQHREGLVQSVEGAYATVAYRDVARCQGRFKGAYVLRPFSSTIFYRRFKSLVS